MNVVPRRTRRPLRSFLIFVCVAGGAFAADKAWLADGRFQFNAADWWSNITPVDISTADIAIAPDPANRFAPQLSMGQLLHGLLYSKPSTGWRLQAEQTEVASAW